MQRTGFYRPDIDGLRAVAVLSVIGYHLVPERIKGGFVGVDVFFVISGFLISSILYNDLEHNRFSILEFYSRRIRRLYPALFLVLISVILAGYFLLLPVDLVLLAKQVVGGSLFVANFVLWWQSGYFDTAASFKPLLHLWSLGVEEQYYLLFPPLCMFLFRRRSRWYLPVALAALGLLSMAFNVVFAPRDSALTYFLPFSRAWELILGALLAFLAKRKEISLKQGTEARLWQHGLGTLGLAGIIAAVFCVDQFKPYPGWWALLPTFGTVMLIAAGRSSWPNRKLLASKPAVFVGLISYPLYLWHWPIYSYLRIAKHLCGWTIPPIAKGILILVSSFVLAYLTYRFVELPVRNAAKKPGARKLTIDLIGSVAFAGALGMVLIYSRGIPARFPSQIAALDHDFSRDDTNAWRNGTCFLRPDQSGDSFSDECTDSMAAHKGPLLFIWGDSHAADLVPGFRVLQQRIPDIRLAQYTASACPPILAIRFEARPACSRINNAVINRIRTLKPQIVVFSAFWYFPDKDYAPSRLKPALVATVKQVFAAGVQRVIILGSSPNWSNDVPILLVNEVRYHSNAPVPHRLGRDLLIDHDDSFLKAAAKESGASYVPLIDKLCDSSSCLVTTGSGWQDILMYDATHFTQHGSVLVAPMLWPEIAPNRLMAGRTLTATAPGS